MSVRLTRMVDGHSLKLSAWSWGVLHDVIGALEVFPIEEWIGARHGTIELSAQEVSSLSSALRTRVLPAFAPGARMLLDRTFTTVPDDGTFHRHDLEKNYSLEHAVLVAVIDLLESAGGPVRVG